MPEQVLDVKGSLKLIRRFWRTVLAFAVLGAVVAAAYALAAPSRYRASTLVLLPNAQAVQTGTHAVTITTAEGIATSGAVLVPAGKRAGSSLPLAALERSVTASALTGGVLQITASGASGHEAVHLANAVASGLVHFITNSGSAASQHILAGMQLQIRQVSDKLSAVQKQLGLARQQLATARPTTPSGQQDAASVTDLTARQANLTFELNGLNAQVAQAQLNQISANQGTEVIQRATAATGPSMVAPLLDALAGGAAGLVVGSTAVLAWRRRDPRLWTRDSIAEAVGAPVLLAVDVLAKESSHEWDWLFDAYLPSAAELWSVRRALHELGVGERGSPDLLLLAFADDAGGVSQALQAVVVAASSGLETALSVVAEEHVLSLLQSACARLEARETSPRPTLTFRAGDDAHREGTAPELTVTVLVVDRQHPQIPTVHRRAAKTVLSVSAGRASAEQLAQVAMAAADGGEPIKAVFVANPVPDDHTAGRVPEAAWPRTARQDAVDANGWLTASLGGPHEPAAVSPEPMGHTEIGGRPT